MGNPRYIKRAAQQVNTSGPRIDDRLLCWVRDAFSFLVELELSEIEESKSSASSLPERLRSLDPLSIRHVLEKTIWSQCQLLTAKGKTCLSETKFCGLNRARVRAGEKNEPDSLTRKPIQIFSHYEYVKNAYHPQFIKRPLAVVAHKRMGEISKERQEKQKKEIALRLKIEAEKDRVYGRAFPRHLRELIFEIDNYICQGCGLSRDVIESRGSWLEADHIVEWHEGGETTLQNGQTLCNNCNQKKNQAIMRAIKRRAKRERLQRDEI